MPRRSTRTQPSEVPEGERRVTRRSLQAAATPDKPEKQERTSSRAAAKGKAKAPSPSPTSRGRGRGRGRSTGGRAKKGKNEEEEEEEAEENVEEETADEEPKDDKSSEAGGSGDVEEKKPARGRGRGRGKAAAKKEEAEEKTEEASEEAKTEDATEPTEEAKEESAETKEETVTPRKGRGRRSVGSSPAKAETPPSSGRSTRTRSPRKLPEETPTRRSGRTRRSAGKEEEATPTKDEDEEMETSAEVTGQKRKREDDEAEPVEKKQKVEETENKDEAMDVDEKKESVAEAQAEASKESADEPKTEAPKESKDMPAADEAEKPREAKESDTEAQNAAASTDSKEDAAEYPSADEPEKKETQPEEPKPMDTTTEPEEEKKEVAQSNEKEAEPNIDDYVLVNKDEVPPADSAEVVDALPKEPEAKESAEESKIEDKAAEQGSSVNESEPTSQPVSVIQEPVSSQPDPPATAAPVELSQRPTENGEDDAKCGSNATMDTNDVPVQEPSRDMAAPSNNIDSVAQEPSATIPNPLFQRQFVANPNIDSTLAADLARKFSVVSYNILADCHAPLSKYPWITPDHLSQEYRNKKLLQELQYLDADIVCLQEVGSEYYENTLKPTMGALGYEGSYMKRVDDKINEGEATFVRTSRFAVVSQKGIALRDLAFKELGNSALENGNLDAVKQFVDRPSVILVTQLRCNNTGNTVTVGNIHVSWEQLAKPDLQCIEVSDALKELVATATPQGAFFICGDFNSWPGSPVYQLTKEGYLSDQSMSELQSVNNVRMADGSLSPLINLWWKGFQHTATNMKSAYNQVLGNEPFTTRYPHNGWVRQVDFVWYSGNTLDTCGVLEAVKQEQLSGGIPNAFFPSDHISLKTDLVFKH